MKIIKVEGLVVGEQNYSESSKILKIFTKDLGIISVLSKGCKRTKSPFKEASSKLIYANFDISYKENGLSTLVGVDIIQIFKNIIMDYHDLAKKMYSFIIVDLAVQVMAQKQIDEVDTEEVYSILISTIKKIDSGIDAKILLDIVMLKYLKYLGVLPNIDSCSMCGSTTDIVTMDAKSFGFICRECYNDEIIVNSKALKLIRMFLYVDIDKITNLNVGEEYEDVHNFITQYYEEHTGIYINIKKQLLTLSKMQAIL